MVLRFWHYVQTRELIISESSSILAVFGRLAAYPAIAGVKEVSHRALSNYIGIVAHEIDNSLFSAVLLACLQLSADYRLTLLIRRRKTSHIVDVVPILLVEFSSSP